MDNEQGFARKLLSLTELGCRTWDGLTSGPEALVSSISKGDPYTEVGLGAVICEGAKHINQTSRNAVLLTNRAYNALWQSSRDSNGADEDEEEIKDVYKQVDSFTEAASGQFASSAVSLSKTRVLRSAINWGFDLLDDPSERKDKLKECKCGGLREKERLEPIPDPNLECIGRGEKILARNLRLWCTSYGEEKRDNLQHSAAALHRLGRLYLHKARCSTSGMLQKLSFIRSCVLLHAARVRYEQMNKAPTELGDALSAFNESLMAACNSNHGGEALVDASFEVSKLVGSSRIEVQNTLKCFDEKRRKNGSGLNERKLRKVREGRIGGVKALNENMTSYYVSLMQNIAGKCQKLLGEPPVRFAIAGLGSMARKEITLYSDFEHVILLEDGCHPESVLEYFRWFTVLFQVIVTGIGETIVPTVCVMSINNLYSEEKHEDCWFYDIFTPCGISFDGMAPHSCATPLGRQILSSGEHGSAHPNELIKTTSEMLTYLDPKDDISRSYNLKDLLSRTCFVFGDNRVFETFHKDCLYILQQESAQVIVKQHATRIIQNPNPQVRDGYFDLRGLAKLNAKAVYYRPFAVLIGSLGRIHRVAAIETFVVLEELKKKGAINNALLEKLSYAFAVICEMRVRASSQVQTQRRVFLLEDIHEMVGEEADWVIKDMMQYLQESISRHENAAAYGAMSALQKFNDDYVANSPRNEVRDWYFCGQYEKAVEVGAEYNAMRDHLGEEESIIFQYWLFKSYYQAGRPENKRPYWDALEQIYYRLINPSSKLEERIRAECHCIMSEVYGTQKRFRDVYESTKKWLMFYLNAGSKQPAYQHMVPAVYKNHLVAAHKDMRPGDEEIHGFLQRIFSQENPECRSTLRCLRVMTSEAACITSESGGCLREMVDDIISHARDIAEPRLLLKFIWASQVNNSQWTDAMRTADYIKEFPDVSCTELEHLESHKNRWPLQSAACALGEFHQVIGSVFDGLQELLDSI